MKPPLSYRTSGDDELTLVASADLGPIVIKRPPTDRSNLTPSPIGCARPIIVTDIDAQNFARAPIRNEISVFLRHSFFLTSIAPSLIALPAPSMSLPAP